MTRSYALERIYVSNAGAPKDVERIYAHSPDILTPGSFDVRSSLDTTTPNFLGSTQAGAAERYDAHSSLSELAQREDVYTKQRVLEHKLSEALNSRTIDTLVNTHG
jgi:hypothetical protein